MGQIVITCTSEDFAKRYKTELKLALGLNPTETNLLCLIRDYFKDDRFVRISKREKENLADKLQVTFFYLNISFSKLVKKGILEREGYSQYLLSKKMFPNKNTIVVPNTTILLHIKKEFTDGPVY
jgi:hypothetical protein